MNEIINESKEFKNYVPPNWDDWFMKQVYLVAEKSKDPSTKVGAILVKDKHVISTGYNGFPINVNDAEERYNDRDAKYKYTVHAEANAVLAAARYGISTMGTILYTQGLPCHDCCKSIIQGGIYQIVIHSKWPAMSSVWQESVIFSKRMFEEASVSIRVIDATLGMTAYVNKLTHSI